MAKRLPDGPLAFVGRLDSFGDSTFVADADVLLRLEIPRGLTSIVVTLRQQAQRFLGRVSGE